MRTVTYSALAAVLIVAQVITLVVAMTTMSTPWLYTSVGTALVSMAWVAGARGWAQR